MEDKKRSLKGSPARDAWKQLHKEICPTQFYGCDLDFVCVSKRPPGIIAAIDYKEPNDTISFSEVIAYNELLSYGIEVYVVESRYRTGFEKMSVFRYKGGDHRPYPDPTYDLELVKSNLSHADYKAWEQELRGNWRKRKKAPVKPEVTVVTTKLHVVKSLAERIFDLYKEATVEDMMELEVKLAELRLMKFRQLRKTGTES